MQICWRPVAPHETNYELLWFSISAAAVASAAIWLALDLPWPHCVFLALTGHPCLTCGATRAAIQLFHGRFAAALGWNPLAFVSLCGVILFDIYAAIVLVTRAPRLRIGHITPVEKTILRAAVITALTLNWIYLLAHWKQA